MWLAQVNEENKILIFTNLNFKLNTCIWLVGLHSPGAQQSIWAFHQSLCILPEHNRSCWLLQFQNLPVDTDTKSSQIPMAE
jgi:hypothetical protein